MFGKKNQLEFYREYVYHGDYSTKNKLRKSTIKKIQRRFEKQKQVVGVYVNSKFNGLIYPVFDLDNIGHLNLFQKLNKDIPYIIIESSKDHYWGILDTPKKNISDIIEMDPSWKICNDSQYVYYSKNKGKLFLRGMYQNYDRKPFLYYTNLKISDNLNLFINTYIKYLSKEGFEFSVNHYKSEDLLEELMVRKRSEKVLKLKQNIKKTQENVEVL